MSSTALLLSDEYQPSDEDDRLQDRKKGKKAIQSCWDNGYYVGYPPHLYKKRYFQSQYIISFFDRRSAAISRALLGLRKKDRHTFAGLRQHGTIYICSLGGGPGCCIEKVKLFLQGLSIDADIHGTICDAVRAWELAADQQGYDFLEFNFKERLRSQRDVVRAVRRSQIVIISYSLEFVPQDCRADYVSRLMAKMSPGSLLIIVDTYFERGGYMPVLPEEAEDALDQAAGAPGLGPGLDPCAGRKVMAVKVWRKQSNEDDLVGALGGLRLA